MNGYALGHVVTAGDVVLTDFLSALNFGHGVNEFTNGFFVFIPNRFVGVKMHHLGNVGDICRGVVLVGWRPSGDDGSDGVVAIPTDIASENDASGTYVVGHMAELLEFGVGGVLNLTEPYIADSDIQWVVVANATGRDAFLIHRGY